MIVQIESAKPILRLEATRGFLYLSFKITWFENGFKFFPEGAVRTKWEFIYISVQPTRYFFLQDGREVIQPLYLGLV